MTELRMPDGRTLELFVSGPEDGRVLVFHHGTPGNGVPLGALLRAVTGRGLRLVSWSRPGYGGSSRAAGRRVADIADDTRVVLDELGAETCLVAGWSGGGPHALACGALLQERVDGVLTIASVAPYDADGLAWSQGMGEENLEEFGAAARGEAELRAYLDQSRDALLALTAQDVEESLSTLLPPVDKAALSAEFAEYLAAGLRDTAERGLDGWIDDDLSFLGPWGFEPQDVQVPTWLWQGTEDLMVPLAHGHWLAERLPQGNPRFEADQGHLSLIEAIEPMLDQLTS